MKIELNTEAVVAIIAVTLAIVAVVAMLTGNFK
jgi:hypothetical protein